MILQCYIISTMNNIKYRNISIVGYTPMAISTPYNGSSNIPDFSVGSHFTNVMVYIIYFITNVWLPKMYVFTKYIVGLCSV